MRSLALSIALLCILLIAPGDAAAAEKWTWPVTGEVITPYRNGDDPYAGGQHRGIDIAAPVGHPVVAATPGTVTFVGIPGSAGLTVGVRTADGRFETSYLHLSTADVREGQVVRDGQRLGAVGTSGRRSHEAPHLHFGVRDAGTEHAYHDPMDFLPAPVPPPVPEPPLPVPVPMPVAPAPAPIAAPAPLPAPPPVPSPLPQARPAPPPLPAPRAIPGRHPRALPARHRPPAAVPGVRHAPAPSPVQGRSPAGVPSPAPAGHRAADRESLPSGATASEKPATAPSPAPAIPPRPAPEGAGGGLDLGWVLACLALATVALILGHSPARSFAGGELRERSRAALGALLRPLSDRRA